jgi:hypothetical protein
MYDATAIMAMSADGKISHISAISIRLRFIDFCDLMSAADVWRRLVELKLDLPPLRQSTLTLGRAAKKVEGSYAAPPLRQEANTNRVHVVDCSGASSAI